ncbi:hypothetical protein [Mesorhizobium sp. M1328]
MKELKGRIGTFCRLFPEFGCLTGISTDRQNSPFRRAGFAALRF